MRWLPLLLIPLLLPGCRPDPEPQPQSEPQAVSAERGATPVHRGSEALAGGCTMGWADQRLEIDCGGWVPLVVHDLVGEPAVNGDGTRVAVADQPDRGPGGSIEVTEFVDGRWLEQRTLLTSEGHPDRVALDPAGERVVYADSAEGIAALWVVPFEGGEPVQLTNAGLADQPREPGQPPAGFVPLPLRDPPTFDGDRLVWTSAEGSHSLELP